MYSDRGAQVLDRLAGSSGVLCLATAAERSPEHFEVDVDRDRKREPIPRIGPHDARGF